MYKKAFYMLEVLLEVKIYQIISFIPFMLTLNLEFVSADHFMRTAVDTQVSAGPKTLQRRQGSVWLECPQCTQHYESALHKRRSLMP
ncbi:hypothetical protein N9357_04855 [bacterium]|jgi:hypothetical protein|nr:hypothetical protein [bacterium]